MTEFTSLVSKFARGNGEGSSTQPVGAANGRKRGHASGKVKDEDDEANESASSTELSTQVRKSMRLGAFSTPGPLNSRAVNAGSIKSRPHQRRPLAADIVTKEEATEVAVRVKTQGRNPGYSAPEVYAHLSVVPDIIDYDLDVLFVGINPGVKSSERSHHFAGPTNHFWPCLSDSGLLPPGVRLGPTDDKSLPAVCNMGLTNLVDRPSRMGNELSVAECRAAAPVLTAKIKKYRPRFVCFVSKQAWEMYTGVGLGLQTAWVSWYDEPEDERGMGDAGQEDFKEEGRHTIQNNLDSQGYRLSTYFENGPSAEKLVEELAREGIPSPFVKSGSVSLKAEDDQDRKPSKTEMDEAHFGVKVESDVKSEMKVEQTEDRAIKADPAAFQHQQQGASGSSTGSVYRGGVRGSRMFVMPSTSGRVTQYRKEDKLAYFKQLAELVRKDRRLRGVKDPWAS
ncbi:hypothetical protein KVV02_006257 [Mortierella alpina]|uniref:Uracil-DNA glycosylase-like domain-containing protein n=1 Tax=Mortierella alpina TaxID=64518 RepID=A0A9P8A7K1_MORAP|nr:hypothetical protein KVV02_006257 [Mortierella alpina]